MLWALQFLGIFLFWVKRLPTASMYSFTPKIKTGCIVANSAMLLLSVPQLELELEFLESAVTL